MEKSKGKEKIIQKIMDDAKKEIDSIKEKNREEVNEMRAKISSELDSMKDDVESKAEHELAMHESKTLAQSRLAAKRDYLEKRESIVLTFVADAVKNISKDKKYAAYISACIDQLKSLEQPLTIKCSKNDKDVVAKAADSAGIKYDIQESSISGGLLAEDARGKRLNLSIDSVIERKMDDIRQAVISLLK